MTFHTMPAMNNEKCFECGELAVIVLVDDSNSDPDGELPLCEEHWRMELNALPSD